jgi:flagellar basal body-associated protein FliL
MDKKIEEQIQPVEKKSKLWIWILIALILIAVGIGIYFWLSGGNPNIIDPAPSFGTSGGGSGFQPQE